MHESYWFEAKVEKTHNFTDYSPAKPQPKRADGKRIQHRAQRREYKREDANLTSAEAHAERKERKSRREPEQDIHGGDSDGAFQEEPPGFDHVVVESENRAHSEGGAGCDHLG